MLTSDGVPTPRDIEKIRPPDEIRRERPLVWVECFQEIPCDPCHQACPSGAIVEFEDINDIPNVMHELCTGCGLCIASCPGLAIFVVDESEGPDQALVSMPYEMLPVPVTGQMVTLLDRSGRPAGRGEVVRVRNPKTFDRTAVVTVRIPASKVDDIRAIALPGGDVDAK